MDHPDNLDLSGHLSRDESQRRVERTLDKWTAAFEEGSLAPPSFAERVQTLETRQLELRNERA